MIARGENPGGVIAGEMEDNTMTHRIIITTDDIRIQDQAVALYDGGWRSDDRDELVQEYGLSDDEADRIVEYLRRLDGRDAE